MEQDVPRILDKLHLRFVTAVRQCRAYAGDLVALHDRMSELDKQIKTLAERRNIALAKSQFALISTPRVEIAQRLLWVTSSPFRLV
jgi:hypothetical protein